MPSSSVTASGSPPRCGIWTATISSANRPFLAAAAARWCEAAAKASCSARVMPSLRPLFSVDSPMDRWSNASVSPSKAIESTSSAGPYLVPVREFGSRCGARLMDSMPPATITSYSPSLISCAASAMASRPDRQTLLTVRPGTLMLMPAATAACRAVICPAPACSTWPMITYWTWSGPTCARSRAPAMATPPSSVAGLLARAPSRRPTGVRAPPTMTG